MGMSQIKLASCALVGLALLAGTTNLVLRARAADPPAPRLAQEPRKTPPADPVKGSPASATKPDPPADEKKSYPFMIDSDDVYEFAAIQVDYGSFHLKAGPATVIPIKSERGIAGAMVVGSGTFVYTPEPDRRIEGHQRAVMLRFNPGEQAAILPLDKGRRVRDRGFAEMSKQLLVTAIHHCWQSNRRASDGGRIQEILIPPKGAFAAVLYSQEHGDLLISFDDRVGTAFNFTDRQHLYDKK